MNGSSILKKTLPIVLSIVLIVIIAIVVSAVKTNASKEAQIEDEDGYYIYLKEGDSVYSVTRKELYDDLKYGIGLSSTITMVNKSLLNNAKVDGGDTSYWDSITDDEVLAAINEACYGEDVKVEDLTATEKEELEEKFKNTMYSGYGYNADTITSDEIKDHYRLVLAKKAYAKAALGKEIDEKNATDDPYFTDDDIESYYDTKYNKEFHVLIVPFASKAACELALQQLGVGLHSSENKSSEMVWTHLTIEENAEKPGVYEKKWGEPLTTKEIANTMIKLYDLVYGYKGKLVEGTYTVDAEGNEAFSEGCDYAITDPTTECANLKTAIEALKTECEKEPLDSTTINPLIEAAKSAATVLKAKLGGSIVFGIENILTDLETLYKLANPVEGEDVEGTPTILYTKMITSAVEYTEKAIVFNTNNTESPFYYNYETLYNINSNLPTKFENQYFDYKPYVSLNDPDDKWVSYSVENSTVYYVAMRIKVSESVELDETLKDTIKDILKSEKLDAIEDNTVETKMAELRKEYNITIFDKEIEANYIKAVDEYSVTYKESKKRDEKLIATVSKDDFKYEITADDLFNFMDKTSGLNTVISDIAYQRLLKNDLFNQYKDYSNSENGQWIGDEGKEKKQEIVDQIENQRLLFLAGSYTSYGYDPTTMTWEDFMYQMSGARNITDMAKMILYSSISADYNKKILPFVATDGEGKDIILKDLEGSYSDVVASDIWQLIETRMQEIVDDYFSVSGEHLLVSMYESVKDANNSGTPLDPTDEENNNIWTDEAKNLAKEFINNVKLYLQSAEGTYAEKLQAVVNAYNAAPYAVKDSATNQYVVAINDSNVQYEYVLKCAEVTLDLAKYKSAGLYIKYESLGTFGAGQMVKPFEDAVKTIYTQDVADQVSDRITVYGDSIETEFGYHLYINLGSTLVAKYESTTLDESGNEVKVADSVLPSLYEVRQYVLKTALEAVDKTDMSEEDKTALQEKIDACAKVVTTEATTAITTYYKVVADELVGSYFSAVLQQNEVGKLFANADSKLNSTVHNNDINEVKKMMSASFYSVYSSNLKYLKSGDEAKFDITAKFEAENK